MANWTLGLKCRRDASIPSQHRHTHIFGTHQSPSIKCNFVFGRLIDLTQNRKIEFYYKVKSLLRAYKRQECCCLAIVITRTYIYHLHWQSLMLMDWWQCTANYYFCMQFQIWMEVIVCASIDAYNNKWWLIPTKFHRHTVIHPAHSQQLTAYGIRIPTIRPTDIYVPGRSTYWWLKNKTWKAEMNSSSNSSNRP